MLDDFMMVVKRREADNDESVLKRAVESGKRFDELLEKLNLPKAPEKDQSPDFSTV